MASLFLGGLAGIAGAQAITEFPLPTGSLLPTGIALGSDGNVWFVEKGSNKIGRITPAGAITEFSIPSPTNPTPPGQITAGPDGNLWFTEPSGGKVGRITTSGVVTEFLANGKPEGIAAGPDGNIWFTEQSGNNIARIDLTKLSGCSAPSPSTPCITEFPIPTLSSQPFGISPGPAGDPALWFVEGSTLANKIGRITTSGAVTEFSIPTVASVPVGITVGPDNALWFTEGVGGKIGRITTSGVVTEFPIPTASSQLAGISAGPGGLWFAETTGDRLGQITTAGSITELPIPTAGSSPNYVTVGSDGALWFTEQVAAKIGRLAAGPPPSTSVTVPVGASIHGAGGSFFHSDVRVLNRSNTSSVNVTAKYHCFTPPCGNSPQTFTLSPREMRVFDDMIAVTFNAAESGGAIEFSSTGSLVVTSRLYTPSRPSPTSGMGVPGIPESQAVTSAAVTSLSHSANTSQGFRSNVGAYNANDVAQNLTFTVFDGNGTQLGHTTASVAARTAVQVSNIFSVIGVSTDVSHAYCVVQGDQNLPLLVYAGVIDNQSQDLAFVQGQPDTRAAGPDRATIPVAASIHGAGGSFFHTDATVLNTSNSTAASVTLRYRCFSGSCGNSPQTVMLAPRQMRAFDDVIANVFAAAESGGAIEFDSDQPIVVNSRLYTPSRPAPTNGMGVPGLPEVGAPTIAILTSLSHSASPAAGFRSNVGAYNENDVAQVISFTLYDESGGQLGLVTANAPPRTSVQVSNVFAAAGFTRDVPNAYCIVHGDQNLPLLAYAGVIDNQSQDLAFIRGEQAQ